MWIDNVVQSAVVMNGRLYINDRYVEYPDKKRKAHCVTQSHGRIYADGYVWKNGKWKRSLIAVWHDIT